MRQKDAELSARIIQSQALWMKDKRLLAWAYYPKSGT